MRYRSKLTLAFILISLLSLLPTLTILDIQTQHLLWTQDKSKVLCIAATTAALLDGEGGDRLEKIAEDGSMEAPSFISMQTLLRKLRNANRRDDVYVEYLYTLKLDPHDPNVVRSGVDAEPGTGNGAYLNRPYYEAAYNGTTENIHKYYAFPGYVRDALGIWLTAQAPIKNSQGVQMGAVGVDISASDIETQFKRLIMFDVWAGSSALILALLFAYFISHSMTSSLHALAEGVSRIGEGDLTTRIHLPTKDEFHDLGESLNEMTKGLQERERLKVSFARYVSSHVMDKILKDKTPIHLEGERRRITVLFSDIRHFAALAEVMPPEEVVSILNSFFDRMLDVIFHHHGTFDKFLGDGLMVEFGAPLEDEQQATHALEAALAMQRELTRLNVEWQAQKKPRLEMGIGIHTGEAIVGNIGTEMRLEYTAVGDTVNVASRLQKLSVEKGVPILLSGTTYSGASKEQFKFTSFGQTPIIGRAGALEIYTVS